MAELPRETVAFYGKGTESTRLRTIMSADLLAVDEALRLLSAEDPRKAQSWNRASLAVCRPRKRRTRSRSPSAPYITIGRWRGHGCTERSPPMPTDRWHRVEKLFTDAVEHPAHPRSVFLDAGCGVDRGMRDEIQLLLTAAAHSADFLCTPALEVFARQITVFALLAEVAGDAEAEQRHHRCVTVIDKGT